MNRWKAAAIHLTISFVLAATVLALLYFLWFPSPYFIAAGTSTLIALLIGADVCIGPLLTLLVVNTGKARRLIRLDLCIIGAAQAIAFAYGIHVIAEARPVFVVAEVDRLVVVAANQVNDDDLAKGTQPVFRRRSWTGPILVGALPPTGGKATDIAMQALRGGKDIDQLPQFYVPYDQAIGALLKRSSPLSKLAASAAGQAQEQVKRLMRADPRSNTLLTLPLERGDKDYTAVISPDTKRPVAVLAIDPWK